MNMGMSKSLSMSLSVSMNVSDPRMATNDGHRSQRDAASRKRQEKRLTFECRIIASIFARSQACQ